MNSSNQRLLLEAGFAPSGRGNVLLSHVAKELFQHWIHYLSSLLESFYTFSFYSPFFIQKQVLERSKYLKHFPHHLFLSGSYQKRSNESFLTPATCLHLYSLFKGQRLDGEGLSAFGVGTCARFEDEKWKFPFRLSNFHMAEWIALGSETFVEQKRKSVLSLLAAVLASLRLEGAFQDATDAFFLGNDEGAKILQKLKGLKKEYVVVVGKERVALASSNNHKDYLGERFGIKVKKNGFAFSSCIAFGIERLTAYSLLKWGVNNKKWPEEFREDQVS